MKTVKIMDASRGFTDKDITVEILDISLFFTVPRVGETVSTGKGHYLIREIDHDIEEKSVTLWIDSNNSDFY